MKRANITDKEALDSIQQSIARIDEQRLIELNNLKQLQDIKNEVVAREVKRLTAKYGESHPRVQQMTARLQYNQAMQNSLDIEIEKASAPTDSISSDAWRLNGKVYDTNNKPVAEITIFFADANKNWIRELGSSCSDTNGYYAITISDKLVEQAQKAIVFLSASDKNKQLLYNEQNLFTPTFGIVDYQDIYLGKADGMGCQTPPETDAPKTDTPKTDSPKTDTPRSKRAGK